MISQQFAKKFFPDGNPVGRHIGFGLGNAPADTRSSAWRRRRPTTLSEEAETPPLVYVPLHAESGRLRQVYFELANRRDPIALADAVREMVHRANAAVPVSKFTTQAAQLDQGIAQERTLCDLCTCFAMLAL